jgi:hypothetical protein
MSSTYKVAQTIQLTGQFLKEYWGGAAIFGATSSFTAHADVVRGTGDA